MKTISNVLLLVVLLVFAVASMSAATVTYNTSLSGPSGTYYGSGNSNTAWAVSKDADLELGLTAVLRYMGPLPVTGNVYSAPLGNTTVPGKSGSAWGYAFSVNTLSGNLSDYNYSVTVGRASGGPVNTYNPLFLPDNSYWGVGGETPNANLASQTGFQNAEAAHYMIVGVPGYNSMDNETYKITLTAIKNLTGGPTPFGADPMSLSILVNAGSGAPVPEPSTYLLMSAGIGAIALWRRRRS